MHNIKARLISDYPFYCAFRILSNSERLEVYLIGFSTIKEIIRPSYVIFCAKIARYMPQLQQRFMFTFMLLIVEISVLKYVLTMETKFIKLYPANTTIVPKKYVLRCRSIGTLIPLVASAALLRTMNFALPLLNLPLY